jgi:hypothetical protein
MSPLKHINNYMFHSFHDFFALVKDIPIDWHAIKDSLKIKEEKYPSNQ